MKNKSEKAVWNPTKSSDKAKIAITVLIAVILLLGVLAAVAIGMNRRLQKADTYVAQGNQYYAQSEYDQAEECYKKAIALKKKDANAYLLLGKTYLAQDDSDSAIAILESGYKATKDAAIEQEISNLKGMETASSNQAHSAAVGTTASENAVAFGQSGTALANSGTPNAPGEQVQSAVQVPQVDADTLEKFAAQTEQANAEKSGAESGDSSADAEVSQADSAENVKQAANASASESTEADTQVEVTASAATAQSSTVARAAMTTAKSSQSLQTTNHVTLRTTTRLEATESKTETTTQTTTAFFEKREDGAYVYTDMAGKKHRISANHVELMHNFWEHLQTETTVTTESVAGEQTTTETVATTKPKTTTRKTIHTAQEKTTQTTAVTTEPIAKAPTYEEEFDNWLESLIYALFLRNIIS